MTSPLTKKRELPAKEAALFKQVLRLYEHKQYKRGLKSAEQILKKFPEHGETLAMKGLFLSHLNPTGNKEEAYEFVKKGLKCDLFSAICWHVYGLLYRGDKNYEEAMKCYRYALKYDKENIQVLRDFSFLQIQMRDYEGFNETKHELLRLRSSQRVYWIGLAISYHLLGQYETALKVLQTFEDTEKEKEGVMDFEHSELLLYKNLILEESGDVEKALEHLQEIEPKTCDSVAVLSKKASYLMTLGRHKDAEKVYRSMIDLNAENFSYVYGLFGALQLPDNSGEMNDAQKKLVRDELDKLQKQYPRSNALKRIALSFADGETFQLQASAYILPMLRKGVPSLFVNIKNLLEDPKRRASIQSLLETFLDNLRRIQKFTIEDESTEPPTAILWVLYFLAQLHDYLGDCEKALKLMDEAIEHTPTLVELYMFQARVYKHAGNYTMASAIMDHARELDLQDRFINTKSTKYKLRADQVEQAEDTIILFARQGGRAEKLADLVEMQCMWFAIESAESWCRQSQYGPCLKRLHQLLKHFDDITDDQFDFHTYCLRKMTLRSYVSLLRFEDGLFAQPTFKRAAQCAIACYVDLFDDPTLANKDTPQHDLENLSAAERKKLLSKQKKAAAKAKAQESETGKEDSEKKVTTLKEDDPHGEKLVTTTDPLGQAWKFLRPLQSCAFSDVMTHVLGFQVAIRQKKILLAFKCLQHAIQLDANHPETHKIHVQFWTMFVAGAVEIRAESREIMEAMQPANVRSVADLKANNAAYFTQAVQEGNALKALAGLECLCKCFPEEDASEMVKTLVNAPSMAVFSCKGLPRPLSQQKLTLANAQKILQVLPENQKEAFRKQCRSLYPLASDFMTKEEREADSLKVAQVSQDLKTSKENESFSVEQQLAQLSLQ